MTRVLILLVMVFGLSAIYDKAAASTISFELDAANSSVSVTETGGFCFVDPCDLSASISPTLGGTFSLGEGETNTFDFIDWSVSDGVGAMSFDVNATLAFSAPLGATTTGSGGGGYFTLFGIVSGGILQWSDLPAFITLADGSEIIVNFAGGAILGLGNAVTSTASVTVESVAAVPLPASALLLLSGFGLMSLRRRRKA